LARLTLQNVLTALAGQSTVETVGK